VIILCFKPYSISEDMDTKKKTNINSMILSL